MYSIFFFAGIGFTLKTTDVDDKLPSAGSMIGTVQESSRLIAYADGENDMAWSDSSCRNYPRFVKQYTE
jgi:hypothetical protein